MAYFLNPSTTGGALFIGIIAGLISGLIIGFFTGKTYQIKKIAKAKQKGDNNILIQNLKVGR